MENYLYFAEGGAAFASTEAAMYPASKFTGVSPINATTTRIYFESPINDVDSGGGTGDYISVTHADTTNDLGGHRCKLIARAVAQAINAAPHAYGGVVTVVDLKNDIYFGELASIAGEANWDIAVDLDG
tara:strand:+ start:366 stop:752 length:387 start_codon:yes stop_codon:yes gene_type:complete